MRSAALRLGRCGFSHNVKCCQASCCIWHPTLCLAKDLEVKSANCAFLDPQHKPNFILGLYKRSSSVKHTVAFSYTMCREATASSSVKYSEQTIDHEVYAYGRSQNRRSFLCLSRIKAGNNCIREKTTVNKKEKTKRSNTASMVAMNFEYVHHRWVDTQSDRLPRKARHGDR